MQQQQQSQRGQQLDTTNAQAGRPYRSHSRPACTPCRRRKSRCQGEDGSSVCLMCRAHGTECVFPGDARSYQTASQKLTSPNANRHHRKSSARPRTAVPDSAPPNPGYRVAIDSQPAQLPSSHNPPVHQGNALGSRQRAASLSLSNRHQQAMHHDESSPLGFDSADDHALNLHIVGPAGTNDSQVLSDYLSAIPGATRGTHMVIPVPASRSRPILFTRVRKQPVGVKVNRSPAAEKVETIEKLLEPYLADVIDVYFAKVNPCFPMLDETSFRRQYTGDKERISPALLACLYAHTIIYWNHSPQLRRHRCPDSRFIWNLANAALYSELNLSPGMSIIKAIVLNITGRPTTSLIGNGVLLGSAVSMGHSLGLNRNPLPWEEMPQPEKYLRMKLWWVLLINDRWISLAHGTPPHISRIQYDVPFPTLEFLGESPESSRHKAASVFIALCTLTDVLDQHLEYTYHVGKDKALNTTNLELALNSWVESLTGAVRLVIIRGSHLDIPGASNLRLCYLTVRLLHQRIVLESEKQNYSIHDDRLLNRYIQARRTSEDILILTQELELGQLGDFWLSISAFTFPATINFLLRCALETENSPSGVAQSPSFRIARELIGTLRSHQDKSSWDLGDVCLAQHADVVQSILASVTSQDQGTNDTFDAQDFVLPDASIIDQIFPSLWDPLQNGYGW